MPDFAPTRPFQTACATLVLAGSLATQGCLFGGGKKPPKVFVPPPVYAKDPAPVAKPGEMPPLPANGESVQPGVEPVAAVAPNLPPPPPKPVAPKPVAPKPPVVVEVPPTPPPAPAPKPAPVFSAAERQRMNQDIEQSLGKVRAALARAEGKNLAADVTTLANQARAFMLNAEQTRVQDLVTAVSLAKRAESFATELVQRLP